jgi:S1-C subfamily serine protease
MRRVFALIVAVGLIALGVIGDRVVRPDLEGLTASAAKSRPATNTSPNAGTVRQVSLTTPSSTSAASVNAGAIDQATEQAYNIASKSVVYVDNIGTGTGSGIIFDSNGDIVTNNHVVSGAHTLRVTLNDHRTFTATVVGTDPSDDLAVIRIHASGLTPATFATKGSLRVAQMVLAIGSPLGLRQSVSSGLISGLGRVEQEPNGAYIPDAVQTSAPINPGNSGGALVTLSGVVVGMPTLEQTSDSSGTSAQAIGFAVPSYRITYLANQIIADGKVVHTGRAYLGISPADSSGGSGGLWGGFGQGSTTPSVTGAVVQQIAPNGPAAKAGVQTGDVITAVNGASVTGAQDLLDILARSHPGKTLILKINRNGNTQTVTVKLGELPA